MLSKKKEEEFVIFVSHWHRIKLKRMNEHIIIYVHNLRAIEKKGETN